MNSTKLYRKILTQKPKVALIYSHFRCYQSANRLKVLENRKTVDLSFFFKPHNQSELSKPIEKNLIIECKNPKLNHYFGVSYAPQSVPLASSNWFFNESVGDYFSILPSKLNLSTETFESIGINENLVKQLQKLNITSPTVTQAKAIKELLNGQNILYIDERGSGKTLGCVVAIIQKLLQLKESSGDSKALALILCPGKEASIYLSETINRLASDLGLKCNAICSSDNLSTQPNADILTSSFTDLPEIENSVLENNLKFLVIDNAQTLCKIKINRDIIVGLQEKCNASRSSTDPNSLQSCWVSPYITEELQEMILDLNKEMDLVPVHSSTFNKVSRHVRHDFLRINEDDKMTELFKVLNENEEKKIPTLIFGLPESDGQKTIDVLKEKKITCATLMRQKFLVLRMSKFGFAPLNEDESLISPSIIFPEAKHIINMGFGIHVAPYLSKIHTLVRKDVEGSGRITNFIWDPATVPTVQKFEYLVRCDEDLPSIYLDKILY